jgi:DNA invertase Pin-like site-specific DNA recombinase
MAKVYSYCRFSAKHQAKGSSIDRQIEKQEAWLKRHPEHTLDTNLQLRDLATSGYHGLNLKDGGALAGFIALVERDNSPIEKGSILLIEALDRFSRLPPTEVQPIFYELVKSGIVVQTLVPEQTITAENINDPATLYPITGYMIAAYEQSKQKAYWSSNAWKSARAKAKEGKIIKGVCPHWLIWDERLGKYRTKDGAKETITYIFESVANGIGQKQIAHELNRKKCKLFSKAKHWYPASIGWLIPNRQLLGEYQCHTFKAKAKARAERIPEGLPIKDYYPRVIEDELFHRANGVRMGRQKQRGPNVLFCNLFVGLVFGVDGFPCWVKGAKAKRRNSVYVQHRFTSQGRVLHIPNACPVGIDYWIVEKMVLSTLTEIKTEDIAPRKTDDGALLKQIATRDGIEKRLGELRQALTNLSPKAMPIPDVLSAITEFKEQRALLNEKIERLQQEQAAIEDKPLQQAKDLLELIDSKPDKEKHLLRLKLRGLIATLIERITLDPYKVGRECRVRIVVEFKSGASVSITPDKEGIWHYRSSDNKKMRAMILRDLGEYESKQKQAKQKRGKPAPDKTE